MWFENQSLNRLLNVHDNIIMNYNFVEQWILGERIEGVKIKVKSYIKKSKTSSFAFRVVVI